MSTLVSLTLAGLTLGGIYVLLALGLQLIFGVMRIVNFAHGVFLMIGGFFGIELVRYGMNPLLAIVPAMMFMFVGGYLVQRVILENLLYDLEMNSILITFGLSIILEAALSIHYGNTPQFVDAYNSTISILGGSIRLSKLISGAGGLLFAGFLFVLLRYSDIGRAIRATAQSGPLAEACGVDAVRVRSLTFAIGSALAGIAGVFYLLSFQVSPYGGLHLVLVAFVIITLAGFGSLRGTVLAGIIVAFLQSFAGFYIASSAAFAMLYLGVLAILLVKPTGLLGTPDEVTA